MLSRLGLTWRLLAVTTALWLVFAFALVEGQRSRWRTERTAGRVTDVATLMGRMLSRPDRTLEDAHELVDQFGPETGLALEIVTPPEAERRRRQNFVGETMFVAIGPVDRAHGFVQIDAPAIDASPYSGSQFWSLTLLFVLGSLIGIRIITALFRTRLEEARRSCSRMADGFLDQRLPEGGAPLLWDFSEQFNRMTNSVARHIDELDRRCVKHIENSELLGTILGTMVEGVMAVDTRQRILFVNRSARPLLRFSSNAIGRPLCEAIREPKLQELVRKALADAAAGKPDEEMQAEFELSRSGIILDVHVSRLPGSPCPGVVLVMHDVTDLRTLENMRTDFVSNVSHELKTPLTSIQGYAETLLEGSLTDPQYGPRFVARIRQQTERLHHLILDLLRLARIESRESNFQTRPLSIGVALRAVIDNYLDRANDKNVSLILEHAPESATILADDEAFRSIVGNLIENGLNYTAEGGEVIVRAFERDDLVTIEVEDTGAGIPDEHLPRIFERFYRVDKARSRDLGGTGLGLSIVKHLVKMYDGEVHVNSEVGQGTTFTITLPAAPQPADQPVLTTGTLSQ